MNLRFETSTQKICYLAILSEVDGVIELENFVIKSLLILYVEQLYKSCSTVDIVIVDSCMVA